MAKKTPEQQAEMALTVLDLLKAALSERLKLERKEDAGFRRRNYKRWKPGLDLFKMFLICSQEFGSDYNTRSRPKAVVDQNFKFEATVGLHARSLRVANEIYNLLIEGFPDGALSRWRSLHELAVTATFLNSQSQETSKRFIAHRGVASWKALKQHDEFSPRSKMSPVGEEALARSKAIRDRLVQEFGPEFGKDMGWAFPAINKKNGINMLDLELATGLDHWRPRYRWASDDIHATHKPPLASLGASESADEVLLVGRSNSAFTDPAHMAVISLNLSNHAMPVDYLTENGEMTLIMLRILSDEVGATFYQVDVETGKKAANARAKNRLSE